MVQFEESVYSETERICWHMMTTGSSAAFEGNPPGTVRRAAAGVGAQHRGQPIGTVPVDHEPSHASGMGRNYLRFSQVYQIPTMQLNRPTLKRNLQRETVFLM